uniref:Dual OB-containing domain-containing protein n=1 Tax=Candidatus Kentrum sp. TC TaxID=2126339 RepID=A0A450YSY7_9GAMM|nr:MAG: hypothetical protein BECKTC1821E_GA0114239_103817 [Candidatus Kentron sp. TC]
MKKVIVVFANSVKHGKHCVAGKDVDTKEWIRPVADAAGKELDKRHGEYMSLQKVKIKLVKDAPLPNQPENWIVGHAPWIQRGNIEAHEVGGYLDVPETLWGIGDRIAYSEIENGNIKIAQSLYLIRGDKLAIYKNQWDKWRASFSYQGNHYDLSVTDPNAHNHLPNPQHQSILCVSLGEKFKPQGSEEDYCFKIVAAII